MKQMPASGALPPGPRSPALFQLLSFVRRPAESILENMRRYGHVHTIKNPFLGPQVIVSEPELVKQIFTGDPEVYSAGEINSMAAFLVGPRSVMVLDGAEHQRQRRRLVPPFHGERMLAYTSTTREATMRILSEWRAGDTVSLMTAMRRITIDVILDAVFGLRGGARREELHEVLLSGMKLLATPLGLLMVRPAFQRNLGPLTPWAEFARTRARTDELLYAEIEDRRAELASGAGARRDDVLSMLLQIKDESGAGATREELRDQLMTLLGAGYDTTATMLCWVFELVLRHPEVLGRLEAEIAAAAPDAAAQPGSLEYVDATIKEALRMYPILPTLGRKTRAPVKLGDHELPAGVMVMPAAYATHHRADLYPEPEAFKPERFLGKKPDPYAWFPFGGGARRCLGMAFALHEMKVVLATMIPAVRLRLVDAAPLEITLRTFFFAPKGGTRAIVEGAPRLSASAS